MSALIRRIGILFRHERGVAVIETAILMPVYMIVLFSLLFLGYLTLGQHQEFQAAGYAAWAGGSQAAEDLLERFYPWVHPDAGSPPAQGAGDAETSLEVISDATDPETTVETGALADYIAMLSVGEAYQGHTIGAGGLSSPVSVHGDYKVVYFTSRDPADGPVNFNDGMGHRAAQGTDQWAVTEALTEAFNGLGTDRWMEIRTTNLAYRFKPIYFRWVYGDEPMTQEEYLLTGPDESAFEPRLERTYRVVARGDLDRIAARDSGGNSDAALADMQNLLERNLAPPLGPQTLRAVADAMFGDGQPLYVAR